MSDDGRPTVVVVDDEELFRMSLADYLAARLPSCRVVEAADGERARDVVRRERVDVLVTDLVMPRVDGLELLLSVHERVPSLPVVVVSAVGVSDETGIEMPVFVEKPSEIRNVADIVAGLLGSPSRARRARMSLAGALHVLERQRRTCRLGVTGDACVGRLDVVAGKVCAAEVEVGGASGVLSGEAAAVELLVRAGHRITLGAASRDVRPAGAVDATLQQLFARARARAGLGA